MNLLTKAVAYVFHKQIKEITETKVKAKVEAEVRNSLKVAYKKQMLAVRNHYALELKSEMAQDHNQKLLDDEAKLYEVATRYYSLGVSWATSQDYPAEPWNVAQEFQQYVRY